MSTFQRVSVSQAKKIIEERVPLVVDVRDVSAYHAEAIPGAHHVMMESFLAFRRTVEATKPVLVYCYHGHASQDMAQMFADFGFSEVYSMDGGYEAWRLDH